MPAGRQSKLHVPRQKSCLQCIKAKRRCDQGSPCERCQSKALKCSGTWVAKQATTFDTHLQAESDPSEVSNIPAVGQTPFLAQETSKLDYSNLPTAQSEDLVLEEIANLLETNPVPEIITIPKERVDFCIHQFRRYSGMLVLGNQTPFIHRHLYDNYLPRSMHAAYAAAALYMAKTEANAEMTWRVFDGKLDDLFESRSCQKSPTELLAQVQALILFQSMRLFDCDIRERSNAEKEEQLLAKWADELSVFVQDSRTESASTWEAWIFAESARRTIFIAWLLPAIYTTVKHGFCLMSMAKKLPHISFSAQKRLWQAPSSFHWHAACRGFNNFKMTLYELDQLLATARTEDIDDFGLLVMVKYRGLDAVRECFCRDANADLKTVDSLLYQVEYERDLTHGFK